MNRPDRRGFHQRLLSREGLTLVGFLLVGSYFLWTEHEAHVRLALPYLPYFLLLLCPLMHLFMHHGHGEHGETGSRPGGKENPK